ncbi:MAG: hypothetical protein KAQ96_05955, partial [Thermoplasmata archaeon]|nr:hypothetical protein [Thermoplasmata archaeon]
DMDYTYNASSYWGDAFTYGIYSAYADIGGLSRDLTSVFRITLDVDIEIHNYYDASNVYIYQTFNTQAIHLEGTTKCTEIKDIDLSISESYHGAIYNATSNGYVYVYNQQQYIFSQIRAPGTAPLEISGLTFSNLGVRVTTGGKVEEPTVYYYNYAILLNDSPGTRAPDTETKIHDITVEGSSYDLVIYMPGSGEWELYDCTFDNLVVRRLFYYSGGDSDYSISFNTFSNIMRLATYNTDLIYIYKPIGEGEFFNNTFSMIDVWRLMYIDSPNDRIYFQYNTLTDISQKDDVYDPLFYIYQAKDKVTFTDNTFDTVYMAEGLLRCSNTADKVLFKNNIVTDSYFDAYLMRTENSDGDVEV